jgi:hypothetical protein
MRHTFQPRTSQEISTENRAAARDRGLFLITMSTS